MAVQPISNYFARAIKDGASDVHLVAGERPMERLNGELVDLDGENLQSKELETQVYSMLTAEQKKRFEDELELDISMVVEKARFRVNIHQQEGVIGLAARLIPTQIPSPDDLRFEPTLRQFATLLDGLILVVGPTGCGKSTTIASLIEEINKTRKAHILTIEDPIEFAFEDKKCLIEQREVGTDTKSFDQALKHALRQDPNIIVVGEMRDPETIATVLTASETGHLVISTLHTSTAAETVERIVDVFEGAKQRQILIQLSAVLRGVVAQQLVTTTKGTLVAAREILVNTPAVANLIKENNIAQIKSAIQTGAKEGMVSMENSLKELLKSGLITDETLNRRSARQRKV